MLKRLSMILGCFVATTVVASISKVQRSAFDLANPQRVGVRAATEASNCGTSCTHTGGGDAKPTAPAPTV